MGIVGLGACLYRVIWPSTLVRLLKLRALNVDTILLFLTLITPLPRSTLNMEPKQEKILSRKEIHHQGTLPYTSMEDILLTESDTELADQGIEGGEDFVNLMTRNNALTLSLNGPTGISKRLLWINLWSAAGSFPILRISVFSH